MILPLLILNENVKNLAHTTNIAYNVDDKTNKKTNKTINYYNELSTIQQYNPLNDKNITGLTTKNGNWIKNKVFVVDFLNKKRFFRPKPSQREVPVMDTIYTYPGDVPIQVLTGWEWIPDPDISIGGGNLWYGGSDTAIFEMSLNIPWVDIESWLNANGKTEKNSKIKSIYLIPEIQLKNPPLNSATISFENIQINGRQLRNNSHSSNIVIPEGMQESNWTASDVLGLILKISGHTLSVASFVPGISISSSVLSVGNSIVQEIIDALVKKDRNYYHTNKEENKIKVASNIQIEKNRDLTLSIPTIKVTGTRNNGYWWDHTEATMTNLYVVLELE